MQGPAGGLEVSINYFGELRLEVQGGGVVDSFILS